MKRQQWLTCSLLFLANLVSSLSQPAQTLVVARTGQAFEKHRFLTFGQISATESTLLFSARLEDDSSQVLVEYREGKSSNLLAASSNSPGFLSKIQALDANRAGEVVFVGRDLSGTDALFLQRQGALIELCREGDLLEDTRLADFQEVSINQTGEVAFTAWTSGARGPMTLFRTRGERIEPLVSSGNVVGSESIGTPVRIHLADSGELLFINGRKIGPLGMIALSSVIEISSRVRRLVSPEMLPLETGRHFENHRLGLGFQAYARKFDGQLWFLADTASTVDGTLRRQQGLFVTTPERPRFVEATATLGERILDIKAENEHLFLLAGKLLADHAMQRSLYRLDPDGQITRLLSEGDPSPLGNRYLRIRDFAIAGSRAFVSATVGESPGIEFILLAVGQDLEPAV